MMQEPSPEMVAGMPVTDDGKRLSDAVMVAIAAGGRGRWIAARLSDGGTDGNVYDTRQDAIRHQLHEEQCCYVLIPPAGQMPPHEATGYLRFNRSRVAAGMRMVDPEAAAPMPIIQGAADQFLGRFLNRAARRGHRPAQTRTGRPGRMSP